MRRKINDRFRKKKNVTCNARLEVAHDSNDDSIRKGTHAIIKRSHGISEAGT